MLSQLSEEFGRDHTVTAAENVPALMFSDAGWQARRPVDGDLQGTRIIDAACCLPCCAACCIPV